MGEAKRRDEAGQNGLDKLAAEAKANGAIKLTIQQGMVLFAAQRIQTHISQECQQLTEMGQRDAATELASCVEFVGKFIGRYMQQAQSSIIVPTMVVGQ